MINPLWPAPITIASWSSAADRGLGGAIGPFCSEAPLTTNVTAVSRRLADLRAPQLASALDERSIVVQPLGAIEQHGPHLPYVTDLLIAERVAEAAVERVGEQLGVWLLPSLAYTKSNEHAWSAGTIWLGAETMLRVLDVPMVVVPRSANEES